jgi:isoleucyl-tRNA synthetase
LSRISQLLAPWAPFISDELWRDLTKGLKKAESVHLSDWPLDVARGKPSVKAPDKASLIVLEEMKRTREIITEGLSQRAAAGIKVRQPLAEVFTAEIPEEYEDLIKEELNVKKVSVSASPSPSSSPEDEEGYPPLADLVTDLTDELKSEGIMREIIRHVQSARKKAGLKVDDRIHLRLESDSPEIIRAALDFKEAIFAETLTTGELTGKSTYSETVEVEGHKVTISLKRAGGKE